ncbi:MAG: type II toxin-antitoxin system PemK/MazF family toxin [bacterium]|nr:type II toxin-antitoxin system PemK/MazF family toxin [bacterium]MDE0352853.1 type II toxin-antitoxin system PemK/MazF family toxin [bacterium]
MAGEVRPHRGEVWLVDFGGDPRGPEQAFRRPALVVSDDRLHHPNLRMVIVVPGTSTVRGIPLHVVVSPDRGSGLVTDTAFQVEQVRAVSTGRLVDRLGRIDAPALHALGEGAAQHPQPLTPAVNHHRPEYERFSMIVNNGADHELVCSLEVLPKTGGC